MTSSRSGRTSSAASKAPQADELTTTDTPPAQPEEPQEPLRPRKRPNVFVRFTKRLGAQGARVILLAAIIGVSGMAIGYALGYPLRYVDYEASAAVSLDQSSLAGTIDVVNALVSPDDLGPGWKPGDETLGSFGVLGADVCGEVIETPTPLSAKEAAVWVDETNGARIISQALRVDRWKAAEEYVDDVADTLGECETFFREVNGDQVKVNSSDLDRDPPITDHVDRRYQSPDGVQDWSMMAVGDVIIAIQYLAATPPPEGFLDDLERSVLLRIAPAEFSPEGVDPAVQIPQLDDTGNPALTTTTAPGG